MRLMGIDYGKKRIGVAISDKEGEFAFAHSVIENGRKAIDEIKKIAKDKGVGKIVVGESLDYRGMPNPIMTEINKFKKKLEKESGIGIVFQPEVLTTKEAERIYKVQKHRQPIARKEKEKYIEKIDASAAALILKSFIESRKK